MVAARLARQELEILRSRTSHERAFWDDYQRAFEDMLTHTSTAARHPGTSCPPIASGSPASAVADIIVRKLESMNLAYPELDPAGREALERARKTLEKEGK